MATGKVKILRAAGRVAALVDGRPHALDVGADIGLAVDRTVAGQIVPGIDVGEGKRTTIFFHVGICLRDAEFVEQIDRRVRGNHAGKRDIGAGEHRRQFVFHVDVSLTEIAGDEIAYPDLNGLVDVG